MNQQFVFVPRQFYFSRQSELDSAYADPSWSAYHSRAGMTTDYLSKLKDEEYKKFVQSEKEREAQERANWYRQQEYKRQQLEAERQRLGIPQLEQTIQQQQHLIQQLQQQLQNQNHFAKESSAKTT
ncbi:hypothetical protein M9Y10_039835 [Tritrichomonas musculus]|uniref:Uncharacterized protein n=1 Tax=Tritrichomonas musculus TaxID=1915356 RepID=A0ABR2GQH9_9EUKA